MWHLRCQQVNLVRNVTLMLTKIVIYNKGLGEKGMGHSIFF